jgi:hypothetical protein
MNSLKNRFAVVCEWPEANAAENETALRLKRAGYLIGKELIIINKNGEILQNLKGTGRYLKASDVDFTINLHFASPKNYDGYSYVALWNPIKFYFDWQYKRFSVNLLTHHDFISCKSQPADDQITRMIALNESNHLPPQATINHTNCGPYHKFEDSPRDKIFYCGINWDKFGGKKSRFSTLFRILDKKNILKIYGPEKLSGGIIPWEGFVSYEGSIPFDGTSTFSTISKSLLGLALSHEAHIESEIASSRLFELIAGGSLPICDKNPFFQKFFGDRVLYVKGETDEEKAEEIIKHYNWAKKNLATVKKMVDELQSFMQQHYDLSLQLKKMYEDHLQRKVQVEANYLAKTQNLKVNILYICQDQNDDFANLKLSLEAQSYSNITTFILSNSIPNNFDKLKAEFNNTELFIDASLGGNKIGKIIAKFQESSHYNDSELFLITNEYEKLFFDHISSLVRVLENNPQSKAASSFSIIYGKEPHLPVLDIGMNKILNSIAIGSVILRGLFPIFITRYIHPRNYLITVKKFYRDNLSLSQRTTMAIKTPNSLDAGFEALELALIQDFPDKQEHDYAEVNYSDIIHKLISKDIAYKIVKKIKILKPLLLPRKLVHMIRSIIRKIRNTHR